MYVCEDCEFNSPQFPSAPLKTIKKLARAPKIKSTEFALVADTRYGRFWVRVMWKIEAPILLVIGSALVFTGEVALGIAICSAAALMALFAYVLCYELRDS